MTNDYATPEWYYGIPKMTNPKYIKDGMIPAVLVKKKIKNSTIPTVGDVYIKGFSVYRVAVYNETDDTVLFVTTNDIIAIYGKTPRLQIRNTSLYQCPLQLLTPAVQVFELDEKLSKDSLKKLQVFYQSNVRMYERFRLPELLEDIDTAHMRIYQVPDEQGNQFPDLKGKSFEIPIPFYCLTKEAYMRRYQTLDLPKEGYFRARRYTAWPIFYVPSRFG